MEVEIKYNSTNLPSRIFVGDKEIRYIYSATGEKLATVAANGSLGNIINGSNLEANTKDDMFMHEYGHVLQSQMFGASYLLAIGAPSLVSALFSSPEKHNERWYEIGANRLAKGYFEEHYGVKWNHNKNRTKK